MADVSGRTPRIDVDNYSAYKSLPSDDREPSAQKIEEHSDTKSEGGKSEKSGKLRHVLSADSHVSRKSVPRSVSGISVSAQEHDWLVKFRNLADKDELDLYTCISCSYGVKGLHNPSVRYYLYYRVPVLLGLQCMVPMCLLVYQAKHFEWGAEDTDIEFRLVGCCMYLYSVFNMYANSSDECRTLFLSIAREHGLSFRCTVIALAGDVINTFCGFSLVVTLFSVFCACSDPYNLVINCIAINFVGNVDNEFCESALKEEAFDDLLTLITGAVSAEDENTAIDESKEKPPKSRCQQFFHVFMDGVLVLLKLTRVIGTLGLGHFFCIVFLCSKEQIFNDLLHSLGVHGSFFGLAAEDA